MTGKELAAGIRARNVTAKATAVDDPAHHCTRAVQLQAIVDNQQDVAEYLGNGQTAEIVAAIHAAVPAPISEDAAAKIVNTAVETAVAKVEESRRQHSTIREAIREFRSWTPKEKIFAFAFVAYIALWGAGKVSDYRAAKTEAQRQAVIQSITTNLVAEIRTVKDKVTDVENVVGM